MEVPGVYSLVRRAILDSLGSMMILPEKYFTKLSPDVDISRLRFPPPKVIFLYLLASDLNQLYKIF